MENKRWMIGLDLTEMDEILIKWADHFSKILKPEVIYFIHVERSLELPAYLPDDISKSIMAVDEQQENGIEDLVKKNFTNKDVEVQIDVVEGKPIDELMHWGHIKKIDFFICGQKHKENGSGLLPHKLSRKLSSSVLFVPQSTPDELKNILVPIDFSDHAKMAMETALTFAELSSDVKITCLHVYQVPIGFYKSGKSHEEFAEIMRENSIKEFARFTESVDYPITFKPVLEVESAANLIANELREQAVDMVILGSKGQSFSSLMLLGSTTEKIIQQESKSLIWVVKKANENIGFLQALSQL